jgi:hypothetical protein
MPPTCGITLTHAQHLALSLSAQQQLMLGTWASRCAGWHQRLRLRGGDGGRRRLR